jgi:hypothetical protein
MPCVFAELLSRMAVPSSQQLNEHYDQGEFPGLRQQLVTRELVLPDRCSVAAPISDHLLIELRQARATTVGRIMLLLLYEQFDIAERGEYFVKMRSYLQCRAQQSSAKKRTRVRYGFGYCSRGPW